MSNTATTETEQLHMSVQVSSWQSWVISVRRNAREFRYSPIVQLLSHVLVWAQVGVIAAVGFVLLRISSILPTMSGVLFPGAAASEISALLARSVHSLATSIYLWYSIIGISIVAWLLCLPLFALGKQGVVTYVLLFALLITLLIAKIIFAPLLLLGV